MKTRLTVTIDPEVLQKAKQLAYARKTNLSALVEELLRTEPMPNEAAGDFVSRWAGRFSVADAKPGDQRMERLQEKYGLSRAHK